MDRPNEKYWDLRLGLVKEALEKNNFEVFIAEDPLEASNLALERIIPRTGAKIISWGGSMTFVATGLYDTLKNRADLEIIDTFTKSVPPKEALELRRKSLLSDLFITGTNALTETGELINLDMYGNRVAAIAFGPKDVLIFVGRNKIVPDLERAMLRIKEYAAPANAIRLDKKTPCTKTACCEECRSPNRICNSWTITQKSFPKNRIKVILINKDMGL
jgi:L-lactate utilization protein LutB